MYISNEWMNDTISRNPITDDQRYTWATDICTVGGLLVTSKSDLKKSPVTVGSSNISGNINL